jgi:hypothetical protein
LTISNENIFPSTSSCLPLVTPSSNRPTFSSIENTSSDNDLQRVPHSWMIMSPASPTYDIASSIDRTNPQVVHNTSRATSMPSWRGYLPMKFEPMTIDQYQITSHFSQKVFLGGIPAELTEGKLIKNLFLFPFLFIFLAELLLILRKFGKCNIKWPKNDGINHNMPGLIFFLSCYLIFNSFFL